VRIGLKVGVKIKLRGGGDSFGIPGEPTEKRAMVKLFQVQVKNSLTL